MQDEVEESKYTVDPRKEISRLADRLEWKTRAIQLYGTLILFLTLVSCFFSTVSIALVLRLAFSSSFSFGESGIRTLEGEMLIRMFFVFPLVSISSALMAVVLVMRRDAMVREGQVAVDILIEETERTNYVGPNNDNVAARFAIRSFNHLKVMPLSGDRSSGGLFAFISIFSALASIAAALFMI